MRWPTATGTAAPQAGRRPAQREDTARRGRRGLRHVRRRRAGARHRRQGRRRGGHDLPPLPDAGRPHRRRLPAPGRGVRRGRPGPAGRPARTPYAALAQWIDLFVDFLVTKHGLAAALQSDNAGFETLHAYFLDRLVPVCAQLLDAAAAAGEIRPDVDGPRAHARRRQPLHRRGSDPRYDARRMVGLLIAGLRSSPCPGVAPDRLACSHESRPQTRSARVTDPGRRGPCTSRQERHRTGRRRSAARTVT